LGRFKGGFGCTFGSSFTLSGIVAGAVFVSHGGWDCDEDEVVDRILGRVEEQSIYPYQ
jgi:hypothetical protein